MPPKRAKSSQEPKRYSRFIIRLLNQYRIQFTNNLTRTLLKRQNQQSFATSSGHDEDVSDWLIPQETNLLPEEKVRQIILRLLKEKFRFRENDIETEFPIQMGSRRGRLDIVIFHPGSEHKQQNIYLIVECKRRDLANDKSTQAAHEQLKSYMSVCPNVQYGVVASHNWVVYKKESQQGFYAYKQEKSLPNVDGKPQYIPAKYWQTPKPSEPSTTSKGSRFPTVVVMVMGLTLCCCFVFWMSQPTAVKQLLSSTSSPLPKTTDIKTTESATPPATNTRSLLATATHTASPTPLVFAIITATDKVNIRALPDENARVIDTVMPAQQVVVLQHSDDLAWLLIRADEIEGWIFAPLAQIQEGSP